MTSTALVVGGTGPTGPYVVRGLEDRGYEVVVLHRGAHEIPELDHLEHLHADPHFAESITEVVGDRTFDVVIGTYGRLRHVASAFAGRCGQFVGVSGVPAYPGYHEPAAVVPSGMAVGAREDDAAVLADLPESDAAVFAAKIRAGEASVLALHDQGALSASLFRYPSIYGPRQLYPRDWSIIKRVVDGRPFVILPDGGLSILTRCAAPNAAQYLLAAVDAPGAAAGELFNVGDTDQYTLRQWTELTAAAAGGSIEVVSLPFELAGPGRELFPVPHPQHGLVSTEKARRLLGYVDAVPAAQALADTVAWYLEHPPTEQTLARMVDEFDYAAEDAAVADYRAATADLLARQSAAAEAEHPYAHPKAPGEVDHRGR